MVRVKIIFNPVAGRGDDHERVNQLAVELLNKQMTVSLFTTQGADDAFHESLDTCDSGQWDLIVAAGGDGTLNEVINGIMNSGRPIKLAVFPIGTMNDFGKFLNLPKNPANLAQRIEDDSYSMIDIGQIDDQYFINVASMGVFTSVAHTTSKETKNILGPLAYYLEGLKQFTAATLPKTNIKIESNELSYAGNYILFLISNSSSIGGFHRMAPKASVTDGKFDCVLIKDAPINRLFEIFLKVFNGQHIENEYVEYFQTNHLYFETSDDIDIDGEFLGRGQREVVIIGQALKMII
jgi:diacylglycerol kinase (ATP)